MQVNLTATIEFNKQSRITFEGPFEFLDNGNTVILTSTDQGLDMQMKIDADDPEIAKSIAATKLLKISNVLAWERNVSIASHRITGMTYSEAKGNHHALVVADSVTISGEVFFSIGLGEESLRSLATQITKNYESDQEDLLLMWREAMDQGDPILRYLLFFRILESVFGSRSKADQWVRKTNPNLELRKGQHNEDISIVTYLRDNIHAKTASFPFAEIEDNLTVIHSIARNALEERLR